MQARRRDGAQTGTESTKYGRAGRHRRPRPRPSPRPTASASFSAPFFVFFVWFVAVAVRYGRGSGPVGQAGVRGCALRIVGARYRLGRSAACSAAAYRRGGACAWQDDDVPLSFLCGRAGGLSSALGQESSSSSAQPCCAFSRTIASPRSEGVRRDSLQCGRTCRGSDSQCTDDMCRV